MMRQCREGGGTGDCAWCRRTTCPSVGHEEGVGDGCVVCTRARTHTHTHCSALTISASYTTPLQHEKQSNIEKMYHYACTALVLSTQTLRTCTSRLQPHLLLQFLRATLKDAH